MSSSIPASSLRPRGYVRPPQSIQIGVREFVARHGETVASDHFGVDRKTVARCAAGFTLQGAVLRAFQEGLSTPVAERS
jgi:hypothetical protein